MNGIYTVKFGERTLQFKYTFRSTKALEKRIGCKVSKFQERFKEMGTEDLEALIHCGLLWKNKALSTEDVEEILDEAGEHKKFQECVQAASDALAYFFGGDEAKNANRAKAAKK
jgi:predicted glycosyltransferase involved in capsule biosynthesis